MQQNKKVLVVEDEQDVMDFLMHVFWDDGYTVVTARDGREGYEMALSERPDLITLDLQMPHDTGTDMYRRMHHHKDLRKIPVIIISALAGRHLAVREPYAVFDKPIDPVKLLSTAHEALVQHMT